MAHVDLTARLDVLRSKGDEIASDMRDRYDGSWEGSVAYRSQVLVFLEGLLGPTHRYTERVAQTDDSPSIYDVRVIAAVLDALAEDNSSGWLKGLRAVVAADVFGDFLEMAEHLLAEGYKDAAAMLAGAVLEDGLRQIGSRHNMTFAESADLSSMATQLLQAKVITRLVRQQIASWTTLRNAAVHGRFGDYEVPAVESLLQGVRGFLAAELR